MQYEPNEDARTLTKTHLPAANAPAVCTVAAEASQMWSLCKITGQLYGTLAANAVLTIAVNGAVIWTITRTAVGAFDYDFPFGIPTGYNQALVVTLAAGGASCTGELNIQYK